MNLKKDLILLLLYVPGSTTSVNEPINGRTRLIKGMFLFREELASKFRAGKPIEPKDLHDFFAWRFGPFSREVYEDLEFLINIGFVQTSLVSNLAEIEGDNEGIEWTASEELDITDSPVSEYEQESFSLSDCGQKFVEDKLLADVSQHQIGLLSAFKKGLNETSLDVIIQYVYSKYPKMTEKSEIAWKY